MLPPLRISATRLPARRSRSAAPRPAARHPPPRPGCGSSRSSSRSRRGSRRRRRARNRRAARHMIRCGSSKGCARREALGERLHAVLDQRALLPRAVGRRRRLGLHADHLDAGSHGLGGDARARRPAAAAERGRRSRRSPARLPATRALRSRRRRSGAARCPSGHSGSRARPRAARSARAPRRSRARASTISAPSACIAATFTGFAPSGTQMIARTPKSRAA